MNLPLSRNSRIRGQGLTPPRSGWLERAARAGYVTSGIIYFVFAALSLSAVRNSGTHPPNGQADALVHIAQQPFGRGLLALTAAGLAGFALWRAVQAIFDPEHRKGGVEGFLRRAGEALGALTYGALGVLAIQMLGGTQGVGEQQKTWVARLLSEPYGVLVVGALGALAIVVGGLQVYRAITIKFGDLLRWHQMQRRQRRLAVWTGRLGLLARAVVLFIIGYFVIRAALAHDPSRVKDVGEALAELAARRGGIAAYIAVSLGFAAFGVYQLVLSRYRRIDVRL